MRRLGRHRKDCLYFIKSFDFVNVSTPFWRTLPLSCRSDDLDYDSQYEDDSDENEFAVSLFDSWMQVAGGAIETVEEHGIHKMTYYDIEIYFLGKEIYTLPQLLLPEDV